MSEELAIREGDTVERKMDIYNDWANTYDADMQTRQFRGPEIAADACATLIPNTEDRQKLKVVDIACGTGEVGVKLSKHGFKFIDGVDGSQKMLAVADSKSVYRKLICDLVQTEKPLQIENGYYDLAVMSGGIANNHVPVEAFGEIIRLVKKGGHVINVTCQRHSEQDVYYAGKFNETLKGFETAGLWEEISKKVVDNYFGGEPGFVVIFRIL